MLKRKFKAGMIERKKEEERNIINRRIERFCGEIYICYSTFRMFNAINA